MKNNILKILDANLNRSREGLRVCEDILRFLFQDDKLTKRIKTLRHNLTDVFISSSFNKKEIIQHRNIHTDKTKYFNPEQEFSKKNIEEIFESNIQRVQESLRVLEEITKLEDINLSKEFKTLRFKAYDVEKVFFLIPTMKKVPFNIDDLKLYVILDLDWCKNKDIFKITEDLIVENVKTIQLKGGNSTGKELLLIGKRLRNLTMKKNINLIINDRIDICMALKADGVHLGQQDIPISIARRLLGKEKIIGISTHNVDELYKANKTDADYISIGPIFKSTSKPDLLPIGIDIFNKVAFAINKPLIAIGGINKININKLYGKNLAGIAVINAILSQENVKLATKELIDKVDKRLKG